MAMIEAFDVQVDEMPVVMRVGGWFRDFGAQQTNGFRWFKQTIHSRRAS
jgi:hypothetical protein